MIPTRALAFRGLADGLRGAVTGARNLRERRFDEQQQVDRLALQKAQQEAFLENFRAQNERADTAQDFTMAREGFASRRTPHADAMIGAGEQGADALASGVGGLAGMASRGAGAAAGAVQRAQLDRGGVTRIGPSQREQEQQTLFTRQDDMQRAQRQELTQREQEMADLVNRGLSGDQEARAAVLSRQPQLRSLFDPQAPVMGSPEWQQAQRFQTDERIRGERAVLASRAANAPAPTRSAAEFREVTGLRKEFEGLIKPYKEVVASSGKISALAQSAPSAQGDIALVFAYMKALDPTSVVRESEYATAENARGVPETIRNMHNKVITGQRITPAQRQRIAETSGVLRQDALANYAREADRFRNLAEKYNFDPEDVLGERLDNAQAGGGTRPPIQNFLIQRP